jgi:hypothetical protein
MNLKEITLNEDLSVERLKSELEAANTEGFDGYRSFVHFGSCRSEFVGTGFKNDAESVHRAIGRVSRMLNKEAA